MTRHIDLHTHSRYSHDGETAPSALVAMAAGLGLSHLAVLDHNRVDGVGEALAAAEGTSVEVIPCVEIDCSYEDANLHVLGYFIECKNPVYGELWNNAKTREAERNFGKLDLILAQGFHLDRDAVLGQTRDGMLSDVTIGQAILADPRNRDNPDLRPYREGGSRSKDPVIGFCWDYMNPGGPAYLPCRHPHVAEIAAIILSTGGTPVLAHPGANIAGRERYIPEIVRAGVRGVEAYCNYHSPEQAAFWRGVAVASGAFFTCGSDYHGALKPSIHMGRHGAENIPGLEGRILDSLYAARE